MKKSIAVFFGTFVLLFGVLLINSCNTDDAGPADSESPLMADPNTLTVSTGSSGSVTVSGGETPYIITTSPDASIASASITSIGVVTVDPVGVGATTVTVQDNSSPVKTINIPITVLVGHGTVSVDWRINNTAPNAMCGQVNSNQIRVTVNGYAPILNPCGTTSFNITDVTAGDHTVTAELLNPSSVVIATATQNIFVSADMSTPVTFNFSAPLLIGTFRPTWTINSQPAGTGCLNATSVRIALGNFSPLLEPCSNGQSTMTSIPAGTYPMVADLLDANNTILSHVTQNVTIQVNQTAQIPVNFTIGSIAGSATINWTVNNGQNCINNGNVAITVTGPSGGLYNSSCGTYSYDLNDLAPGTYTFDLVLTDPSNVGQQASARISNVNITDHNHTTVTTDINCLFCGGTSSTGFVKFNISCGGSACGLTGKLYVIVKDCGSPSFLNKESETSITLDGGTPISHTINNVLSGGRCAVAFLDVDGNGTISAGDAVSTMAEHNIIVFGGQTTEIDIMLDSVSPKADPANRIK